jgi:MFS family permease
MTTERASDDTDPFPAPRHAWYAIGILTLANASAFIDRQVLGLLVAPIRRDLGISDTQMGVLYGLAFALFYTLLGIPIGRLADRGSRRLIIGLGIAVWSVMTILCALARSYEQLLLARFGVGIGEAALAAPALSLIADYFPRDRRATALSVYTLGVYLGAGLANLIGGLVLTQVDERATIAWPLIGDVRSWQSVFVIVGLPGIVIALLMATIREPARRETGQAADAGAFAIRDIARYLLANRRAFLCHNLGYALFALVNFATGAWLPTSIVRTFGWTAARAGITLGILTVTVGTLGVVVGGRIADAVLARGYTDAKVRVGIIAAAANIVCGIAYTFAPTPTLLVAALVPYNFFAAFAFGAAAAAIQEITPNRMRAQVGALYVSGVTLIGLGLGPSIVALLTDRVFGDDSAVRYSLLVVTIVGLSSTVALLAAGLRAYRRSVVYRAEWGDAVSASGTR